MTTCCKKLGLELTELAYLSRPHLRIAGQLFVIHARDFDVDVAAVQERAADFLLVVGDSSATALLDGGVVEATRGRRAGSCCTLSHALLQHSR
jgi:hypothetical protein